MGAIPDSILSFLVPTLFCRLGFSIFPLLGWPECPGFLLEDEAVNVSIQQWPLTGDHLPVVALGNGLTVGGRSVDFAEELTE